jgi:hypothetical protein
MARIENSFEMDVPPEQAQAMFVRDIAPDLAKDGGFQPAHEKPGLLLYSDALGNFGAEFDPEEVADPDVVGHEEEDDEPEVTAAEESHEIRLGAIGIEPNVQYRDPTLYAALRRLTARHVKVQFEAEGGGTRVTISGSAEHDIRRGLDELGTQGHWPETADQPHS